MSLLSHDGDDDEAEDDYFLCAKKAEAEELYLSLTFVIGCGQKAREDRVIELALPKDSLSKIILKAVLFCDCVPITWYSFLVYRVGATMV